MNQNRERSKRHNTGNRFRSRGAAVLEFAVVAPLLFTIVFGVIEFGWQLMVRQTMVQASQVAARTASLPGVTDSDITDAVENYLSAAGYSFSEYTVQLVHATPGDPTETVTVSIPMDKVSITGFFGTPTGSMTVTSVVPKEGEY